ncbi:M48 family metallopeptidase [Candidatus Micrarchaeota archaeon]|nr:M48 family metallopeptidase [Candidatus Micrarchaeota archaeon]
MGERVSFFDAIDANKRNSLILLILLFGLFFALILFLSYTFDLGVCGPILGFGFLLVYSVVSFYAGDKIILTMSGAKSITKAEYPYIFNVVEGLSLASGVPMPQIYLVNDPAPNAFATGRDPQHSALAVTSGLLEIMNREELEGVLAHEMSHIANYDIRFTMIAVVFAGAIAIVGDMGWRMMFYGGGSRRDRGGGGVLILLALVFAILAPIFAELVKLAISRQREYLADANGVRLTRYPDGLAKALEKIKAKSMPTQSASSATASLYLFDPFPNKLLNLFATHPPIDDRIKRLRSM